MQGSENEMMFRLRRVIPRAGKLLPALVVPWILACAGAGRGGQPEVVPVFFPGERVNCLFEVLGSVTVRGPFRTRDDIGGGSREAVMRSLRLEVGKEGADSGANAVMVREIQYQAEPRAAEDNTPEIVAVEGMLLSFVDPTCVPDD